MDLVAIIYFHALLCLACFSAPHYINLSTAEMIHLN